MFRFKRSNAGALPEPFSVGEVVILSSATELALSQVILIPVLRIRILTLIKCGSRRICIFFTNI